jgi:hypothetical protein
MHMMFRDGTWCCSWVILYVVVVDGGDDVVVVGDIVVDVVVVGLVVDGVDAGVGNCFGYTTPMLVIGSWCCYDYGYQCIDVDVGADGVADVVVVDVGVVAID